LPAGSALPDLAFKNHKASRKIWCRGAAREKLGATIDEAHASIQCGEGVTSEAYTRRHQQHGTPKPFCTFADGVEIIRVIHGARDIERLFR
jgi:hypothetical protein